MRALTTLTILIMFIFSASAQAKTAKSKKHSSKSHVSKKVTPSAEKSQIGTSFSFDAASVRGKYQMAGQGLALVEDEKVIDDLLGLRKQFKDREQQESSRW